MNTSSKKTEPRPTGLVPMSSKCVRVIPGWLRSTKKALTPRAPSATLPVRAKIDGRVALVRKAHRGLFAVEAVAVTGLLGAQDEVGGIRPTARLGKAQADDGFAAGNARQPFVRDAGRGVLGDHPTHQGSQQLNVAGVEVAIGDLLDDDPGRGAALAEAAIFFRKVDTDQPEIAHFLEHRAVDAVLPGAFLVVRSELLPRIVLRSLETPAAAR